jgi:hypothetical protein
MSEMGPIADTDGSIDIEIRDLDQTVIGGQSRKLDNPFKQHDARAS